jgi:hypothetical protein
VIERTKLGQFPKGVRSNPSTEFKPGQHWRERKPYWDREWLEHEYVERGRSSGDIANEFGVTDNAIWFWLNKHGIPGRDISAARKLKHWGCPGEKNPMYGKRGVLNPLWRGGLTPARQQVYAKSEWREFARDVRKRDKTCRLCESAERLEIHHIDPFSLAPLLVMDMGNAILLCHNCHKKMQGRELRWRKRLYTLLKESAVRRENP